MGGRLFPGGAKVFDDLGLKQFKPVLDASDSSFTQKKGECDKKIAEAYG